MLRQNWKHLDHELHQQAHRNSIQEPKADLLPTIQDRAVGKQEISRPGSPHDEEPNRKTSLKSLEEEDVTHAKNDDPIEGMQLIVDESNINHV